MNESKYIYIIPVVERSTVIGSSYAAIALMEVDGIGLYVKHALGHKPTDQEVRNHLIGVSSGKVRIYADTPNKALGKFHTEWDGAKTGTRAKAMYIETTQYNPIIEYPTCEHYKLNPNEYRYCSLMDDEDYNFGCWIDGFDWTFEEDDYCPCKIYKAIQNGRSKLLIRDIKGHHIARWKINNMRQDFIKYWGWKE